MSSLSIVIPTVLRPSVIETANRCAMFANDPRVEVVVSINPLAFTSQDADVVHQTLLKIPNIRIEIQSSPRFTAESSAMNSICFAGNEWIWFLGDDDHLSPHAIEHVLLLIENPVDFWLVNCTLNFPSGYSSKYYSVGPNREQVGLGKELFQKFGLVSATTTLSCLVIRKKVVDLNFFNELHSIQGVYSHSFSLFACLFSRKVGVSDMPLVNRAEGTSEQIQASLQSYVESQSRPFHTIFTTGLLSLIKAVSERTGMPMLEILRFREIEIIKNIEIVSDATHRVLISSLGDFILAAVRATPILDPNLTVVEKEIYESGFRGNGQGLVMSAPVRVTLSRQRIN
jgi:hypothetical protein